MNKVSKLGRIGKVTLAIFFISFLAAVFWAVDYSKNVYIAGRNQEKSIPEEITPLPSSSTIPTPTLASAVSGTPKPTPIVKKTSVQSSFKMPKPKTFGYSVKGRTIQGYIFGKGSQTILLFGAIHGNEKGTSVLLKKIATEIAKNSSLVGGGKRVVIIPTLNPDGYYVGKSKLNAHGVNLNLNFETTGWKQYGGENNDFAGKEPFTEPESRALRDVVLKYKVRKMVSFHAKGGLVNPEIHAPSEELALWYVAKSGYKYFEEKSWDYPGTATKWFTQAVGGPAITVELSDYNETDWYRNEPALLGLIK